MIRFLVGITMATSYMSCVKEEAVQPTFIQIPEVMVSPKGGQGTADHDISEIWVYVDNELLGAFSVGNSFPVISEKPFSLDLFAGIRENGQALDPRIYPFYQSLQVPLQPTPDETQTVRPVFPYHSATLFKLMEDFEQGHSLDDDLDGDPETLLEITDQRPIEGKSARGTLTQEHPVLEVATSEIINDLPTTGESAFLELQYRSDVPVQVGLRGHGTGITPASFYKLVLFPTEESRKIYINIAPDLQASQLQGYQVIFLATFDVDLKLSDQLIYFDNIKLLHF